MFLKNFIGIHKQADLKISIVGGSNSVIRKGYAKYLERDLGEINNQTTSLKYFSLGGVPNIFGLVQQDRFDIAGQSDVIFYEYCVNDRHIVELEQYSLELAGKSLEGFIRKCQKSNPNCLIVILIFGVNQDNYYQNSCALSELYESIGKYYSLPVVNVTTLLKEKSGLDFVKSLYSDKDDAHYTRPHGVKVVSQLIIEQLKQKNVINSGKLVQDSSIAKALQPIYEDNFENLAFFEDFDQVNLFSSKPKVSVFQNTVFKERNFSFYQGDSCKFLLKGRLAAIFIKSDPNDGFVKIDFNSQQIVTSSYSAWISKLRPQNITMITLPLLRFTASSDFSPVSINLCQEYPDNFELDYFKTEPEKKDPQKWKLSVIGIAYIGEIRSSFELNSISQGHNNNKRDNKLRSIQAN